MDGIAPEKLPSLLLQPPGSFLIIARCAVQGWAAIEFREEPKIGFTL